MARKPRKRGPRPPSGGPTAPNGRNREGGRQRPANCDQLEGRNPVMAALEAGTRKVRAIWIDRQARPSPKLEALESLARSRGVPCPRVLRTELTGISEAGVHNGVIGFADHLPQPTLKQVLTLAAEEGRDAFIVILNEVQYEQNLGAILRTAAAAGADAVLTPTRRGSSMSPTVQRIAMGGAEVVPIVREGMQSALTTLRRSGVRVLGAEADGSRPYHEADFTGPLAIVLGGEDRGLGAKIRERCDELVAIPLPGGGPVSSLNVSVAGGLLIYERVRQTRRPNP